MEMYLKRQLSSVKFWIFLTFLLYKNHRVASSRHAKQILTLFDQNAEEENLKVKVKKSLEAKSDLQLQDVISCDCRDFCPDPNSSELQVSFDNIFILYCCDYSGNKRAVICVRHISAYFLFHFSFI